MLVAISLVPCAAWCTFVAISRVAAPCCSTAEAIEVAISLIWPIVAAIAYRLDGLCVDAWILLICTLISSVALPSGWRAT